MSQSDITTYAHQKGWALKATENNTNGLELIFDCPFCGQKYGKSKSGGKKRPLYINADSGVFHTWCCNKNGNMVTLRRELGDLPAPVYSQSIKDISARHKTTASKSEHGLSDNIKAKFSAYVAEATKVLFGYPDNPAMHYLASRGFTKDALDVFEIGSAMEQGREYVVLPSFKDGSPALVKLRRVGSGPFEDGPKWKRLKGGKTELFGLDQAMKEGDYRKVFITEAELDAVALHQYGFEPCISVTAGAGSWPDSWLEDLSIFDEIIFVYDNDDAGIKGAALAAEKLGHYRCSIVTLPEKDASACLEHKIPKEIIQQCIGKAVPCAGDVVRMGDFADEARDVLDPKNSGTKTQWEPLNQLLGGGLRGGEVWIFTGDTGTGKTTFLTDLVRNLVVTGNPTLFVPPEMQPRQIAQKLISMIGKRRARDMEESEFDYSAEVLKSMNLFTFRQSGRMDRSELSIRVEYAVRRLGVRHVVLDHLDYFVRARDDYADQDEAIQEIVDMSHKLDIWIGLVCHPKKMPKNPKTGEPMLIELDDIRGSSGIKQYADGVIRCHRKRTHVRTDKDDDLNRMLLTTLKVRSDYGEEGNIVLHFDKESLRYSVNPFTPDNQAGIYDD